MKQSFFIIILLCLVGILLTGCRTKYIHVPVETFHKDSIYIHQLKRDSIYLRDSVYIREKGDTVFVDKFKYLYKEIVKIDTFRMEHTDTITTVVEVEKPLTRWQKLKMELGGIAFGVCVALLAILVGMIIKRKL